MRTHPSHLSIIQKIQCKDAKVGIVGLGYVGLPHALAFYNSGFNVTGFDIDQQKVNALIRGECYIKHITLPDFNMSSAASFHHTTDFDLLRTMDCILVYVPTPLNANREPDMSFVFSTARCIAANLRVGQLICMESTTYPGTTDNDMRLILEETGLKAGVDFCLAFSLEREDPNNKNFSLKQYRKC